MLVLDIIYGNGKQMYTLGAHRLSPLEPKENEMCKYNFVMKFQITHPCSLCELLFHYHKSGKI